MFDHGVATLRDAGFVVDRQDHRFGQITSKPRLSPTVFEPWKTDHTYADQAWRATLGSLRRTVRISLTPVAAAAEAGADVDTDVDAEAELGVDPRDYDVRVEVLVERQQVPTRRLNGRTRGGVFEDLRQTPAELQRRGIDGSYWQPIGRDVHLEARLQQQILDGSANAPNL